ncbi:hypothetical protein [Cryobacterium lactosi]|nr:hypothetical protein [Cryobacterium lactosi]
MDRNTARELLRFPAADSDWADGVAMSGTEEWLSTEPQLVMEFAPED